MALNHEGPALQNIELVNANAGLMAELDQGWDTLAAMMEQVSLLQAQLVTQSQSQSQDVLPASANDDGRNAMDLQGSGGHSSDNLMRDWSDISYVDDTPIPCRQDIIQQSAPPVHTTPDIVPPGEVYFPFPPSSGRSSNTYYPCPGWMSEQDQVHPVPGFNPKTQEQSLCTIWRPTTKTFQVILKTFPYVTPTQATCKHQMSYCLEQIDNIDGRCLHFVPKEALVCHVCYYISLEQACLTASQPCHPDNLPVVYPTAGGFCHCVVIQSGSGQVNRRTVRGFGFSPSQFVSALTTLGHYSASLFCFSIPILLTNGEKASNDEPLLLGSGGSILSSSFFSANVGLAHLCNPAHRAKSGFSSVSLPCNKMPPNEMDCTSTGGDKVRK